MSEAALVEFQLGEVLPAIKAFCTVSLIFVVVILIRFKLFK